MITLVLGGARSGKSEVAERIAARLPAPITYLATLVPGNDPDLAARIDAHRARRPAGWRTVEAGAELPALLRSVPGPVLLDGLGPWVAASAGMIVDTVAFRATLAGRGADTVVVSEEVGLGVHPATEDGRRFRDALGELNQSVAAVADEVLLVVAGRTLRLDPPRGALMRRALSFLTPFGGAAEPAPSALAWFPAVGALIGLGVGGVWWVARRAWPSPAAAAIALIADAALTGMLHLDGLADAAGALASMMPSALAMAGLWSGSRAAMAVTARAVPYARPAGLASAFRGPPAAGAARPRTAAILASPVFLGLAGGLLAAGLAFAGRGAHGLAAVGAESAGAGAVVLLAWRRLGGFTGDVLGAAAVVGETAGLLTLAGRW